MIARKPTKPRTLLLLDSALFVVVSFHLIAAISVNLLVAENTRAYFTWHRVLGFSGVALAVLVGSHLYLHLPWIQAQTRRALGQTASRHENQHS